MPPRVGVKSRCGKLRSPGPGKRLLDPFGVAVDARGNVFVSDNVDNRILKVATDGTLVTFAGDGLPLVPPDNAKAAWFAAPWGIAFDANGKLLATSRDSMYQIDVNGISKRIAGSAAPNAALLLIPFCVVADNQGGYYVCDVQNQRVWRVDAKGVITTVAGDGSLATLNTPCQAAVDGQGNLYVADMGNNRVRVVSGTDGKISTFAGTGVQGNSGDGGPADAARITNPMGVAFDKAKKLLFIAEGFRIRMVDLSTKVMTTVVGGASGGFSGDGGVAANATLSQPAHLAVDGAGNVYVSDRLNYRVRMLKRN